MSGAGLSDIVTGSMKDSFVHRLEQSGVALRRTLGFAVEDPLAARAAMYLWFGDAGKLSLTSTAPPPHAMAGGNAVSEVGERGRSQGSTKPTERRGLAILGLPKSAIVEVCASVLPHVGCVKEMEGGVKS